MSDFPSQAPAIVRRLRSSSIDIKPSQIHALKLQTQQMQQQTRVLNTQLKRLEFQIHSQSTLLNQRLDPSLDSNPSPTIHASTIPNLQREVESARNTLATLKAEIADLEADDQISAVDELEEELKMAYGEYIRLSQGLREKKGAVAVSLRELQEAEAQGSQRRVGEMRALIREMKEENVVLWNKANAYQLKIERLNVEDDIVEALGKGRVIEEVLEEAEEEQKALNEKLKMMEEQMQKEVIEHNQKMGRLSRIIETMKEKIDAKLRRGAEVRRF
jgi:chromosome segregation ATPase